MPRNVFTASCIALLALGLVVAVASAAPPPPWLPRYSLDVDLDVAAHLARVHMRAVWTNPQDRPTNRLVFNAHSHYVVPDKEVGFMAKMLEILRMDPAGGLFSSQPPLEVQNAFLVPPGGGGTVKLEHRFEGDTHTSLVLRLPRMVEPGQSIEVGLDFLLHLPAAPGRWGYWEGVTYLSNWLPVFAYFGPPARTTGAIDWQPTPFVPWHQPFFNEAGHYRVTLTVPAPQKVACTGTIVSTRSLDRDRTQLIIEAAGVRDFAILCCDKYQVLESTIESAPRPPPVVQAAHTDEGGETTLHPPRPLDAGGSGSDTLPAPRPLGPPSSHPVHIQIYALPGHEFYAREMLHIAEEALATYSKWFGPYPYRDFRIAESFFGWNGNECSTLVMIDSRIFALPHLATGVVQSLVFHEICHQWWYNMVGTNGYSETWMDEALATHFSHRLLNKKIGRYNNLLKYPDGLGWLPNIRREDYRSYGMYGTLGRGENTPVIQDMNQFGHVINLFSMCYDKGSRILGLIEDRLGEAAFFDFMRLIFNRYQYRILRVADFQRELELYTHRSWQAFFDHWLYGPGVVDWVVESVKVKGPPRCRLLTWRQRAPSAPPSPLPVKATIVLQQKVECTEQTILGIALPGQEGYPIRIPIRPWLRSYPVDEVAAQVQSNDGRRVVVEVSLPAEPEQVMVDPDQLQVDLQPTNNYWKPPVRFHFCPIYTFMDETDLTNPYDRWNVLFGPWIFGTAYYDPWYTRSTMIGARVGLYRTQNFYGGAYAAYRTNYRDIVLGMDALWDHWPGSHMQVGLSAEQRLVELQPGQNDAKRASLFLRYVMQYTPSLYLQPMEYVEGFTSYQDDFLPYVSNPNAFGVRYNETATAGFHYHAFYLTPYWNPLGGYWIDAAYEGGIAYRPSAVGLNKVWAQASLVKSIPDLSPSVQGIPGLQQAMGPVLRWLGHSQVAVRAYGGTSSPSNGEFFAMGGSQLFRGFDLAQRQGSSVWVGSAEWRFPLATGLNLDFCDHVMGLRGIYGAAFVDAGNMYVNEHAEGPTAYAVGGSLRLDVAWLSFVERTLLRVDVAKTVNIPTGIQMWFAVGVPF